MTDDCPRKRLAALRESAKDPDILFLLERLDVSEKKRGSVLRLVREATAEAQYHLSNWKFYKREIDKFILTLQAIITLDYQDGKLAQMCDETLRAYEEVATNPHESI